ncbi:basic secretory protein-like protein [Pedobacter cryotolerans]|uniref:Secretory protein n=1 Tax=Pedobacter cryotolerans TaxID=2571270 RepID=A0A4U1BXX8_9SPHI|nr:basic secretory protein-like protein [Pedobacter cryotolerans]TKB97251.1 secretory protein [Pedobacter cryotolerans]
MNKSILFILLFVAFTDVKAQKEQLIKRGDYSLIFINNDHMLSETLAQDIANTYFGVYPKMVAKYNQSASKIVTISIDTNYKRVAISGNNKITIGALWMQQHKEDTDLITHELVHVAKGFKSIGPEWLIEGIADCGRFEFGLNNAAAGWSLPPVEQWQSYKMGYRVAARFLLWIDKYQQSDTILQLSKRLKEDTYTSQAWNDITGKSLDELWALYLKNTDMD